MHASVMYISDFAKSYLVKKDTVKAEDYHFVANIDVHGLDDVFRTMNVVNGDELPTQLRCRSMSRGDIVRIGGKWLLCAMLGWEDIPKATWASLDDKVRDAIGATVGKAQRGQPRK